jgi:Fe-S-cluster-containing hydrogenase component 2
MMYDTGKVWPDNALPEGLRGKALKLASKCDLCYNKDHEPACVLNCPNACAFRVGSLDAIQKLLPGRDEDEE